MENVIKTPSVIVKVAEVTVYGKGHAKAGQILTDKNDNTYARCTFQKIGRQQMVIGGKQEFIDDVVARSTTKNLFDKSYLPSNNGRPDAGRDVKIGGFVFGDIVTKTVPEYEIQGTDRDGNPTSKKATTYTTLVFGMSTSEDWNSRVASAFKSQGHPLPEADAVTAPATKSLVDVDATPQVDADATPAFVKPLAEGLETAKVN